MAKPIKKLVEKRTSQTVAREIVEASAEFVNQHGQWLDGKKIAASRARKQTNILTKLCKEYRALSIEEGGI